MHFLYVDESGDPGPYDGNNTPYYLLTGIIVGQEDWKDAFDKIKKYRAYLFKKYGFPYRLEIHSSEFVRVKKLKAYKGIRKSQRMKIFEDVMTNFPKIMPTAKLLNVCLDKRNLSHYQNFQLLAWDRLVNRFDRFLKKDAEDLGMVIADVTDEPAIRGLVRRLRAYNPITSHFGGSYISLTDNIIEDPVFRDSMHSMQIQFADCIVTSLRLREYPKGALKKFRAHYFFQHVEDMCVKKANKNDLLGIVRK